ncbi:MAG: TRAP transporter small permease [Christensenellales bacterium]|jgi:TRAP-type C4-dicarboxylate transport system permease small subunit
MNTRLNARNIVIRLNKVLIGIEKTIMLVGTWALLLIMMIQVVCRYLLYIPTPWAEEACRYIFIWTAYMGGAYAVFSNGHLEINIIDKILKNHPKGKRIVDVAGLALLVIFVLVWSYIYGEFVFKIASLGQRSPGANINMVIPMFSGLLGGVFMLIHGVSRLFIPDIMER